MQFLIAEQSLTLSFPLEAEYDLSDFNFQLRPAAHNF